MNVMNPHFDEINFDKLLDIAKHIQLIWGIVKVWQIHSDLSCSPKFPFIKVFAVVRIFGMLSLQPGAYQNHLSFEPYNIMPNYY